MAIIWTSVLYQAAIIGCAVRHHNPLAREILYFCIARYITHFFEFFWAGRLVGKWNNERTSRWSMRLYGDSEVNGWEKVKEVLLSAVVVTKPIPLIFGSVSLGLYHIHGWMLARWLGIIAFTDIGVRLSYTCTWTFLTYVVICNYGKPLSRVDLSDLPEDMTNYSRDWKENVKNSWWKRHVLPSDPDG